MNRRFSPGLLYFVLFFLLLELISRTVIAGSASLSSFDEMDHLAFILSQRTVSPRVLYLGSSQTQASVATRDIATNLGMPLQEVLSASVAAAGPREMLAVYQRSEHLFQSAEIVYINIDTWVFNRYIHMQERHGPATWRRSAGLYERLRYPASLTDRADWLLGWAVATWDQRYTWRSMMNHWLRNPWTQRVAPLYDCFGRPIRGFLDEEGDRPNRMTEANAMEYVNAHTQNFALEPEAIADLKELVNRVKSNGSTPVLLRLPASQLYLDKLAGTGLDLSFVWGEVSDSLPDVETLDVSNLVYEEAYWWDPYHLSRAGAIKLATTLSDDVASRLGN